MVYLLPVLSFLKLRLDVASMRQAVLPPYKGSMLRGAFGVQLKQSIYHINRHKDLIFRICFH